LLQAFKQLLTEIAAIAEQLAPQSLEQVRHGHPILHVAGRKASRQQSAFIVDPKCSLKP
jgi:hypothetical protein